MIVDEAHNVAPSRLTRSFRSTVTARRRFEPYSRTSSTASSSPPRRTTASARAGPRCSPLLDDQRFAPGAPPIRPRSNRSSSGSSKSELVDKDGKPRFPKRQLVPLEVDYPKAEREAHENLARYQELRQKAAEAGEGADTQRTAVQFLGKLLKKRLFSSPQAFLSTIEEHPQDPARTA